MTVVVGPADPLAPDVAAALTALTTELAAGGYTAEQTFGYSPAQLASRGVHLVAARVDGALAGVGGVEVQAGGVAELKRFWVDPGHRGAGVADAVMAALVEHAAGQGVALLRLETGDRQHAALRFYARHGFVPVPRFPPYEQSATSVCLQRPLWESAAMTPETFRFVGGHGVTITAYRWDPATTPQVVVQLTHGMGEHALRYAPFAAELTARGAVVVAQDHRGHGASVLPGREPGDLGPDGWPALVEEIGTLTRHIRDAHPGLPLVLLGHSMGSFAVQQHLLDHSADVDAAVLTGTAALDLLEPALDLDQPISLAAFNAPFAPARTDYDWLSRDDAQVDAYVADPLCGFGLDQASGRAMFVGARPLAEPGRVGAMRRDLPLLVAVGEADPVNAGMALVAPLVERYRAALDDVTLLSYPQARHEILNETNRDEVDADVIGWIAARTPLR